MPVHKPMNRSELGFAAMETLGRAVLITDRRGVILYVNPAFTAITGYDAGEVMGKTPAVLRSGRQSPAYYRQMWQGIEQSGEWEGTLWNRRKDGRLYHERLNIRRTTMAEGEIRYVGVFSDISEQDALQRALVDAQKRELMAAMTGGVAHNFNNYLAAIQGLAQLGQKMTAEPKSSRYFSEILSTTEKASALVRTMLKIAHPDPSLDHALDLGATVRQAVCTAQSILPDHIELVADLPGDDPCLIIGNRPDIEQMLLNLVTNARDALEGRQDARIQVQIHASPTLRSCPEPCPYTTACPVHQGRHVTLKVEDNGGGIPEAIRDKIFDPFFTTKGSGKGSGLGLASATQIVGRLGGAIWCDASGQGGSAFHICLPLLDATTCEYEI